MISMLKTRRQLGLGCLAFALAVPVALAQKTDFPTKPVVLVVPYSPGGGADGVARAAAKRLAEIWGQPVLVENMPGADGLIATRRVMAANPDGHTLLISNPSVLFFKHTHKEIVKTDPMADLVPVSLLASGPSTLVVQGKSSITNIAGLKQACTQPQAKCSWASGEQFTLLAGTALTSEMGLSQNMANVRYNGTSAAVADVIGGHVTLLVTGIASVGMHHQSGAARILAVSTSKRIPSLPDVPTYAEVGLGNVDFVNIWYGIFAPKGTPPQIRDAIGEAMKASLKDPAVLSVLQTLRIEPVGKTPSEFAEIIKKDEVTVAALIPKLPK